MRTNGRSATAQPVAAGSSRPGDHRRAPRRDRHRYRSPTGAMGGHDIPVNPGSSGPRSSTSRIRPQADRRRSRLWPHPGARTIASSIAENVRCDEVHMYAIDCGSGGLLPLADLPHCGAVVQRTRSQNVPCACWGACWTRSPDGRGAGGRRLREPHRAAARLATRRIGCRTSSSCSIAGRLGPRSASWTVGDHRRP